MTYQIVSERKAATPAAIQKPADTYKLVKRYAGQKQEHFIVITLDGAHKPISVTIASIGLVNRTLVHPREVFNKAVGDMATAVIICHNHPSGQCQPSDEDNDITERLVNAGQVLGIPVIDHLVITRNGYFSYCENDCMPKGVDK
jgi:DNA repair protein RadC